MFKFEVTLESWLNYITEKYVGITRSRATYMYLAHNTPREAEQWLYVENQLGREVYGTN